jgi:hypothetical protein
MENITLYKHQADLIRENPPRYGLFHDMGTGKTITLLSLAGHNKVCALIVCPKSLKTQWLNYVREWQADHVVMTKEEFKKYEELGEIEHFDCVIIDEGHHFSNTKSALYKQMKRYIKKHNPTFIWIATGTPYRSSAMNIYALATLLGHEWSYPSFQSKFFTMVRMGARLIPKEKTGPQVERELQELVNTIGGTLTLEETGVTVPTQTDILELFPLTPEQTQAIKDLDEPMHITRFTKTHCIENGLLYSDGYSKDQSFPSLKLDRLFQLASITQKLAIVCRYTAQIDSLASQFTALGRSVYVIDGRNPDRAQTVLEANSASECIVLIQAQCSEGYELQTIATCVFLSLSFSHVDHVQMKARFLRINRLKENTYYYLISKGVDKAVYDCIQSKRDFHEALFYKDTANMLPF